MFCVFLLSLLCRKTSFTIWPTGSELLLLLKLFYFVWPLNDEQTDSIVFHIFIICYLKIYPLKWYFAPVYYSGVSPLLSVIENTLLSPTFLGNPTRFSRHFNIGTVLQHNALFHLYAQDILVWRRMTVIMNLVIRLHSHQISPSFKWRLSRSHTSARVVGQNKSIRLKPYVFTIVVTELT